MLSGALAASGAVAVQALAPGGEGLVPRAHAASKAAKNKRAHAACMDELELLCAESEQRTASYKFMDLTGDGVHEMMVECSDEVPATAVYTFSAGEAALQGLRQEAEEGQDASSHRIYGPRTGSSF